MELRRLFALNLRRLRRERKLSQEALAHEAGVDRAYLSRVERAVTFVGLEIVAKLAAALRVDPAEFFRAPAKKPAARKSPRR